MCDFEDMNTSSNGFQKYIQDSNHVEESIGQEAVSESEELALYQNGPERLEKVTRDLESALNSKDSSNQANAHG